VKGLLVNLCRLVLAVTFVFSGFVKAVDPLGTQYKMGDYLAAWGMAGLLPDWTLLACAIALASAEFCLGLWLLFAIRRRVVSRLLLLVMLAMTPLTLWVALTDPVHDCGCFGDALVLTNWQTFWKNVALLACAAVVAAWPTSMGRFVSKSNQWIVLHYTALFILAVAVRSVYYLPLFDFRPYHVGANLREGVAQRWSRIDSPFLDFSMERSDGSGDIAEAVLASADYTMLLVCPQLETADDSRPDLLNRLYEYALENDVPFYCLTASGQEAQQRWNELTGAEYPYCNTDPIVLKTVIRSSPGLVLLHDGVVIRKWSRNDLPDEDQLAQPLSTSPLGQMPDDNVARRLAAILLWFVLPLALLTLADRFWFWTKWVRGKQKSGKTSKNSK